jgi:hypothetical protein
MSQKHSGEGNPFCGKKHTQATKDKLSEAKTGEKNNFYGKKHSEEAKAKMSDARSPWTKEHHLVLARCIVQNLRPAGKSVNWAAFENSELLKELPQDLVKKARMRYRSIRVQGACGDKNYLEKLIGEAKKSM